MVGSVARGAGAGGGCSGARSGNGLMPQPAFTALAPPPAGRVLQAAMSRQVTSWQERAVGRAVCTEVCMRGSV